MANSHNFPLPSSENEMDDFLNSTREALRAGGTRSGVESEMERENAHRLHQQFVDQLFPPGSGVDGTSPSRPSMPRLRINHCTVNDIRQVHGISHVRAQKIISIRGHMHKQLQNVTKENLKELRLGIPESVLDQFDYSPLFKPVLTLPPRPPDAAPTTQDHRPVFKDTTEDFLSHLQYTRPDNDVFDRTPLHHTVPKHVDPVAPNLPHNRVFNFKAEPQSPFANTGRKQVRIPKGLSFDGTGTESFATFREKFRKFLHREDFQDSDTELYALSLSLRGKASEFYERTNAHNDFQDVHRALDALRTRFDPSTHWKASHLQFQSAAQAENESTQDFEDRLWTLAHQAYPHSAPDQVEREVLLKFILGLRNKGAVRHLSLQNFNTVREATDGLKIYEFSTSVSDGRAGNRQVRWVGSDSGPSYQYQGEVSDYSSGDTVDVRQVHKNVPSQNFHRSAQGASTLETMRLAIDELTGLVKGMAGSLKSLHSEVKELRAEVKELRSREKSPQTNRSRSPAKVSFKDRPRSPSPRNTGCFICGSHSHFQVSCPQRQRVRSVNEDQYPLLDFGQEAQVSSSDDSEGTSNQQQDFRSALYHNPST